MAGLAVAIFAVDLSSEVRNLGRPRIAVSREQHVLRLEVQVHLVIRRQLAVDVRHATGDLGGQLHHQCLRVVAVHLILPLV